MTNKILHCDCTVMIGDAYKIDCERGWNDPLGVATCSNCGQELTEIEIPYLMFPGAAVFSNSAPDGVEIQRS